MRRRSQQQRCVCVVCVSVWRSVRLRLRARGHPKRREGVGRGVGTAQNMMNSIYCARERMDTVFVSYVPESAQGACAGERPITASGAGGGFRKGKGARTAP